MKYLNDTFEDTLWPIFAFKPAFMYPDGIFCDFERIRHSSKIKIIQNKHSYYRSNDFYKYFIQEKKILENISIKSNEKILLPNDLLEGFSNQFFKDISLLKRKKFLTSQSLKKKKFCIEGNVKDVFIHPTAKISKTTCINVENGPVVISKNVKISAFSFLKGPLFIDKNSELDNINISNSRVGQTCRLGGEIADSLIGNFSNKHHEGFLGHSIVGDWVNLGALTTTSDLKNNYSNINLIYKDKEFSAETIKFGSIIGDYVKTAIGTLLNTGTIIDIGSLLFSGRKELKYYSPFFWGGFNNTTYELNRFIEDTQKIMLRRNVLLSKEKKSLIENYYNSQLVT